MKEECGLMVNALLGHGRQKEGAELLKFLPVHEAEQLKELFTPKSLPGPGAWNPEKILEHVHYSWIVPVIKRYASPLQSVMLSSVPWEARKGLSKLLKIHEGSSVLSKPVKRFFAKVICEAILNPDRRPPELLPESPLNALLKLNKHQLVRLIDLLGLHDLAMELRQVLDRNLLNKCFGLLSESEQQFLRYCLQQPDIMLGSLDGLDKWLNDRKKMSIHLHLKGLYRLAAALAGQSSDLLWYLVHRLDTGRGERLEHYLSLPLVSHLSQKQIGQVVEQVMTLVVLFLKQDKSSL